MRKARPLILLIVVAFVGLGVYFARNMAGPTQSAESQPPDRRTNQPKQTEIAIPTVENRHIVLLASGKDLIRIQRDRVPVDRHTVRASNLHQIRDLQPAKRGQRIGAGGLHEIDAGLLVGFQRQWV